MMRLEVARRYFTRLKALDTFINSGCFFHPETFLKCSMADLAMVGTQAIFHIIRKDGSIEEPLYFPEHGDELPSEFYLEV